MQCHFWQIYCILFYQEIDGYMVEFSERMRYTEKADSDVKGRCKKIERKP